ncbi:hypothetical protein PIB30_038025 [Stylosanthes scabra]|uniref:Uncharacterized protein n=1 Tax=Stylosanthes scabra TaxID=79078 RepID=A0ABU6TEM6_9FABA|nr:hypothetical protein [Stylosanthes scabra]
MDESINQNVDGEAADPGSNDAANPPTSNESQSQLQTSLGIRGKTDPAWKYVAVREKNGKPEMAAVLDEIEKSKKKKKVSFSAHGEDEVEDPIDQAIAQEKEKQEASKQAGGDNPRKKVKVIPAMFAPRTTPGAQPSLKSAFQSKEVKHEVDMRVGL